MYESQTYEAILQRMLDRVSDDIDKRPGSVIYDALAPAAVELAQMYVELDINQNLSYGDTATGEYLTRRCAEFGVHRQAATKAIRLGKFYAEGDMLMDIPIGSRFSIETVNYVALEKVDTGIYHLECETAGEIGNQYFGTLLPIEGIQGLVRGELTDVLVPGEDEETDDTLRQRYFEVVNRPAFGGNVADYKQKISAMDGVGAVKVFPVWQGGGTVKCSIIASDWSEPSQSLIDEVQETVDPSGQGSGIGIAPIGHEVTIAGVQPVSFDVVTTVTLAEGVTTAQIQEPIEEAIEGYLLGLRKNWANEQQLVVRVALIEAAILGVSGVIDITGTTLNGSESNVILGQEEMPIMGTVVINV